MTFKKAEFIRRYGEAAWEKVCQQSREWYRTHPEEVKERGQLWRLNHPDGVKARNHESHRKGGKYYEHHRVYNSTGLQGERNRIRRKHAKHYQHFKHIIAPDSQLHHEWYPETANYRGVALVEKEPHQYGFIDVIQILEGEITLLTEGEIRNNEGVSE